MQLFLIEILVYRSIKYLRLKAINKKKKYLRENVKFYQFYEI